MSLAAEDGGLSKVEVSSMSQGSPKWQGVGADLSKATILGQVIGRKNHYDFV